MQRAVRDEWAEWVGRRALGVKKIQLFKGGSGVGEAGESGRSIHWRM